jgi:hypothetical protein
VTDSLKNSEDMIVSMASPDPSALTVKSIRDSRNDLREEGKSHFDAVRSQLTLRINAIKETMANSEADMLRQIASGDGSVRDFAQNHFAFISKQLSSLTVSVTEAVNGARLEAQTANNALQVLLESAMAASTKLADVRFAAQEVAITKTETAIDIAKQGTERAMQTALNAANTAVKDVDTKSQMRHDAALQRMSAVDQEFNNRLRSQGELIDLRAKMSDIAVEKANDATEKRFDGVNEFRQTLSDQARDFVSTPILTARTDQLSAQIDSQDRQSRQALDSIRSNISGLTSRIDRSESTVVGVRQAKDDGHGNIGNVMGIIGGCSSVLMLIVVVGLGIINHQPTAFLNPTVGADTKRVDDLITRFDSLSNRLTPGYSPPPNH